jgi:TonB family protein
MERNAAGQPANAMAHHTVATLYHEKANDRTLSAEERRTYLSRGLAAEERALAANPDYVEALVFKNIFLRTLAESQPDVAVRDAMMRDADGLRGRALALQSERPAAHAIPEGTVVRPGVAPPPPPPPPGGVDRPIEWVYAATELTSDRPTPVKTKDVRPIYAPMVIASGIKGDVVLEATVDSRGKVAEMRVVQTQPLLTQATIDAVRQWEFDPRTIARGGAVITVTARFAPPSAH